MANRPQGASAVGLTYIGGERVIPYYGGGMSTAKAALQIDAKQLASNLGPKNIRVNIISAGPYASRAAPRLASEASMPRRTRPHRSSSHEALKPSAQMFFGNGNSGIGDPATRGIWV